MLHQTGTEHKPLPQLLPSVPVINNNILNMTNLQAKGCMGQAEFAAAQHQHV